MQDFYLKVLGIAQDGGYPQAGCYQKCCKSAWENSNERRLVASIALIDYKSKKFWLIDITPDFKTQLKMIDSSYSFEGIFLTHAHLGHYIGLLDLGLEVMDLKNIPVYLMQGMKSFLENNAPFNSLIYNNNIILKQISNNSSTKINKNISISPFLVPHRNELSETVGYKIISIKKTILYLPDIDSWEKWDIDIFNLIKENDILFLDGTFYDKKEIKNRDTDKIPHPSIMESIKKFKNLSKDERSKVFFTHLNHTNNLLRTNSVEFNDIINKGYNIAYDGQIVKF